MIRTRRNKLFVQMMRLSRKLCQGHVLTLNPRQYNILHTFIKKIKFYYKTATLF